MIHTALFGLGCYGFASLGNDVAEAGDAAHRIEAALLANPMSAVSVRRERNKKSAVKGGGAATVSSSSTTSGGCPFLSGDAAPTESGGKCPMTGASMPSQASSTAPGSSGSGRATPSTVLQLANLSYGVRGASSSKALQILENVNLDVRAGEILGIVGESGSGKTTLLTAMLGGTLMSVRETAQ